MYTVLHLTIDIYSASTVLCTYNNTESNYVSLCVYRHAQENIEHKLYKRLIRE